MDTLTNECQQRRVFDHIKKLTCDECEGTQRTHKTPLIAPEDDGKNQICLNLTSRYGIFPSSGFFLRWRTSVVEPGESLEHHDWVIERRLRHSSTGTSTSTCGVNAVTSAVEFDSTVTCTGTLS